MNFSHFLFFLLNLPFLNGFKPFYLRGSNLKNLKTSRLFANAFYPNNEYNNDDYLLQGYLFNASTFLKENKVESSVVLLVGNEDLNKSDIRQRPGYPKQANLNISVPGDPNDLESEDFLDQYKKRIFGKKSDLKSYGFPSHLRNKTSNPVKQIIISPGEKGEKIIKLDDDEDFDSFDDYFKKKMGQKNEDEEKAEKPERDLEYEEQINKNFEKEMQNALGIRFFVRKGGPMVGGEDEDNSKSENFEIITNPPYSFEEVGGYENVKAELMQSVDMLKNFEKYQRFNVRTPKGIILEGPPGNGKTLLARAFSGEVNSSFIPVSGSQFQEKYVGVGASRIRELFDLAENNLPCVIFIDEIDAVGRSRSSDDATSNTERDQTLNQLLVALDGYKNTSGIFLIGATNRVDLLDEALTRPGRIDKKIYIGNPDAKTREKILNIHIKGKPHELDVRIENLVDMTNGLSGAQIENLLNEAMLYALRENRESMVSQDLEHILGRMLVGYQPNENAFSDEMIYRISIHEMGHAIVGLLSNDHSKLVKVCLNLWSPSSPGYTIFEQPEIDSYIYTKERLMARLMVLLGGRIAEEVFFGNSITSGASKDIDEAYSLAEKMIVKFGMGKKTVYPYSSENSKEFIDRDIERLLESAYQAAHQTITNSQGIMEESANLLIKNKLLLPDDILKIIQRHHIENS